MRWNIIVECVGEDGQRSTMTLGTMESIKIWVLVRPPN